MSIKTFLEQMYYNDTYMILHYNFACGLHQISHIVAKT